MFGFPPAPRSENFRFAHNLLKTVVFQVKFPEADVLSKSQEIKGLLASSFPISKEISLNELRVEMADKTPIVSARQGGRALEFQSSNSKKIFTLKNDELSLTVLGEEYVNYETVLLDLERTIYSVGSLLRLDFLNRVAIRKINLINFKDESGSQRLDGLMQLVFNPVLAQQDVGIPSSNYLFSSVHNSTFVNGTVTLNVVHGILPELAPDGARQIVYDIDLFDSSVDQRFSGLHDLFSAINVEIFNAFTWSINPELISMLSMNAREASTSKQ
ncbi:TIGR04255 family protein [Hymenobacter sp. BT491]|uniref:TIGR04255 family protein n=1 Tax=Hymenobacter sp. BT491 TaxID=2766779 RepID=UPI0016539445|nr:TIGR04255 family protein [Hymenobacter sp. BT491]MBC6991670.1 TIGR04255 family protein [Hymenobacter sp. BT491]